MTRERTLNAVLAALALGALGGCRLADCTPADQSRPISASEVVAGTPGTVRGVVLAIATGAPVPDAQVRILPGDTTWRRVSADGRFEFPSSVAGVGLIEVRAPGLSNESVSLRGRSDSAVAIVAALADAAKPRVGAACGREPGAPEAEQ